VAELRKELKDAGNVFKVIYTGTGGDRLIDIEALLYAGTQNNPYATSTIRSAALVLPNFYEAFESGRVTIGIQYYDMNIGDDGVTGKSLMGQAAKSSERPNYAIIPLNTYIFSRKISVDYSKENAAKLPAQVFGTTSTAGGMGVERLLAMQNWADAVRKFYVLNYEFRGTGANRSVTKTQPVDMGTLYATLSAPTATYGTGWLATDDALRIGGHVNFDPEFRIENASAHALTYLEAVDASKELLNINDRTTAIRGRYDIAVLPFGGLDLNAKAAGGNAPNYGNSNGTEVIPVTINYEILPQQ